MLKAVSLIIAAADCNDGKRRHGSFIDLSLLYLFRLGQAATASCISLLCLCFAHFPRHLRMLMMASLVCSLQHKISRQA